MLRNHRTRLITALFALMSLLFMQLAVASYTCPGLPGSGATSSAAVKSAMADMPCAEEMAINPVDSQPSQLEQSNLCHAHCQVGQQSADKNELPSPVHITALPANFTILITAPVFLSTLVQTTDLKRTTAPPLALQNCCLRL